MTLPDASASIVAHKPGMGPLRSADAPNISILMLPALANRERGLRGTVRRPVRSKCDCCAKRSQTKVVRARNGDVRRMLVSRNCFTCVRAFARGDTAVPLDRKSSFVLAVSRAAVRPSSLDGIDFAHSARGNAPVHAFSQTVVRCRERPQKGHLRVHTDVAKGLQ